MPSLLNNAAHWRLRAKETRELADSIADADTKETLLKIAEEYERLATRAIDKSAGE